ncbi:MAG: hypothetical protein IH789_07250 [Acidobacteria bacterium]|nr:hypothetical protein [Acidobacteriota bacterium]
MTERIRKVPTLLFLSLAVLSLTVAAAGQEYTVETFAAPAPEELAPAVRETLASEAVRVLGPKGPFCDIWLRDPVPVKAGAAMQLGIAYNQLRQGSLLGAIRFHGEVTGYRKQRVQPGVYTLRYALHPVDGNHMGVAPQRDFLLLAPAADDQTTEALPYDELVALSHKVTGTRHPSVWSLVEPEDDPDSLPALIHWEEEGLWILYLKAQAGEGVEFSLALVIVGYAPEA